MASSSDEKLEMPDTDEVLESLPSLFEEKLNISQDPSGGDGSESYSVTQGGAPSSTVAVSYTTPLPEYSLSPPAEPVTAQFTPVPVSDEPTPLVTPVYEPLPDGQYTFIVFDLETTGFGQADIVQIAAKIWCGDIDGFDRYVLPDKSIDTRASEVTHITIENGKLYKDRNELPSIRIDQCLNELEQWLAGCPNPVLIAHNCFTFDSYVLTRQILQWRPSLENKIIGFVDTLPLFREKFPGKNSCALESLLKDEGITYGAHDACEDVKALHQLLQKKNIDEQLMLQHSRKMAGVVQYTEYRDAKKKVKDTLYHLIKSKVLSGYMAGKMAKKGITLGHLEAAYTKDTENGIRAIMLKKKVTSKEEKIKAVEEYFASLTLSQPN